MTRNQELEIRNLIKTNFLHTNNAELENVLSEFGNKVSQWFYKSNDGDTLQLPYILKRYCNNSEALYIIHHSLRERFNNSLWTYEENDCFTVKKVSKNEFQNLNKQNSLENDLLDKLLGFTKIFRLICSLSKPIIGHNILMDLILLLNTLDNPLPQSYTKFKKYLNDLIPNIYDTKTISFELNHKIPTEKKWQKSILGDLYFYFKDGVGRHIAPLSPLIQPHVDVKIEEEFHNAGWDSYYTGYIFIRMAHIYASNSNENVKRKFMCSELLHATKIFKNKINVIRCSLSYIVSK